MKPTPKLPVLDARTFAGPGQADTPCLLDLAGAQFTQSGRAAILLALEALHIQTGDQVLVPTYHCPTMVAPIVALGAEALFYPINDHGAPQMDWVAAHATDQVRAMLVPHFFGLPQPLAQVRQWCQTHGVRLIEDCAHAMFGDSEGHPVGSTGDFAIASLTKFLPVSEGGVLVNHLAMPKPAVLTALSAKAQLKAAFDMVHTSVNFGRLPLLAPLFDLAARLRQGLARQAPVAVMPPAESTDTQAGDSFSIDTARAHQELSRVSQWMAQHAHRARIVARRREYYRYFVQAFTNTPGMRPLLPDLPDHCAPYVFPLWLDEPDPGYAELRRLQYPVSRWDWLWPTTPTLPQDQGKRWSHHVLQLACHQDLTRAEMARMVTTLKRVYAQ